MGNISPAVQKEKNKNKNHFRSSRAALLTLQLTVFKEQCRKSFQHGAIRL